MPNGAGGEGEITVKLVLSGEELQGLLGALPAGAQVAVSQTPMLVNVEKGIRTSPTFLSIFKPLVALEAVKTGVKGLLQHSMIANTYLGAMGKMFGAAVDLLLLPFTPLLNLLMMAMGKLLQWLVTSGILEKISAGVEIAIDFLKGMWDHLRNIWSAIKDFDLGKLIPEVGKSIGDVAKFAVQHPIEAAILAGATALMARGAWRFLFGAPISGGGFGAGFMGMGAGARALGGGGVWAGLGRAGLIGGGAAMMGYGMYQGATGGKVFGMGGVGGGLAGLGMAAGGGALLGGTIGSMVPVLGTGIGAGVGAAIGAGGYGAIKLGEKMGWFGGGEAGAKVDAQLTLQAEANTYLRQMAMNQGNIQQSVTINSQQPELVAQQVLDQARAQGMTATME